MPPLTNWIGPLLEKGLTQYLSSIKAIPFLEEAEHRFSCIEELSYLRIRFLSRQHLFLVEFGSSEGHVEAILADCETRVESVFASEAVKLWQVKARSLITSFPLGTLFEILDSELRVSDCFVPPKVQLWIHSFRIVGGLGSETPFAIKGVEASSNLQHLLQLYAKSKKIRRANDEESVIMSSPLRSQESVYSLDENHDHAQKSENNEINTISQPFYTQISQTPAPKHPRQPLISKQPRVLPDTKVNQRTNSPGISAVSVSKRDALAPTDSAQPPTDTTDGLPNQTSTKLDSHKDTSREVPLDSIGMPSAEMPRSQQGFTPANDHWPGGRTPVLRGRYLPRYITKVCKDQQAILETPNAWQPSITDRQIRGSVPNHVLKHFTELAHNAAELAAIGNNIGHVQPPITEDPNRDMDLDQESEKDIADSASDSSDSPQPTEVSWPPTPNQALQELPDNSSPLKATEGRFIPSLSQDGSPVAKTGDRPGSQQEQNDSHLSSPERRKTCAPEEMSEAIGTTRYAQIPSDGVNNEPHAGACGVDSPKLGPMPLLAHKLPEDLNQGQDSDSEQSEACSSQLNTAEAPQPTDSMLIAPQTQTDMSYQKGDVKALIQVQRTPFFGQPTSMIGMPTSRGQQAAGPFIVDHQLPHSDPEQRSSPSVVLGTFMHVRNLGHSDVLHARTNHEKAESSGNELDRNGMKAKVTHLSESAEIIMDASPEGCASPESEAQFESDQPSSLHPLTKRKRCIDKDLETGTRIHQSSEVSHSRSSRGPSKKPRIISNFPSLEALRDPSAPTSAQIARESRRAFFRNQERAAMNTSPLSTSTSPYHPLHRIKRCGGVRVTSQETSPRPQPLASDVAPTTNLRAHTNSTKDCAVDRSSRLSLRRQSVFNEYKATYPDYQGNALQFHKACRQIKALYEEGKAPHPSLWDDFIFRRHHDYREYLLEISEACEDALPYAQYYTEHVEKPSRMQLVVTKSYVLSLERDSALGSSVKSPSLAAPAEIDTTMDLEGSVAASSSASNILPSRRKALKDVVSRPGQYLEVGQPVDPNENHDVEQSQESSVKQWVEQQSIARLSGAESPELGSTDITGKVDDVSQRCLDDVGEIPASSPPACQPAVAERNEAEPVWWDDPNTPFKNFARSYNSLAKEKRQLKGEVQLDEKGCLKPNLNRVIGIFSLYAR